MGRKKTILIADDDEDYFFIIRDVLHRQSSLIDLRHVEDGEILMDYLRHSNDYADPLSAPEPELILMDINMPRKTGLEALKEIRSDVRLCMIPVVMMTASDDSRDVEMSYLLGANSFVTKPVSFQELRHFLEVLVPYWFSTVTLPSESRRKSDIF